MFSEEQPIEAVATDDAVPADSPQETDIAVAEAPVEKRDPDVHFGLDHGRDGTYEYCKYASKNDVRERELVIDGTRYHHCREDNDGCWLYRRSIF